MQCIKMRSTSPPHFIADYGRCPMNAAVSNVCSAKLRSTTRDLNLWGSN